MLEEPVEHHGIAVLVGVGEVQHEGGFGLEPADVGNAAVAGDQGEATGSITLESVRVVPVGQRSRVPEQRQVAQDAPVLGEGHVVGQSRTGQRDLHVVGHLAVGAHHAVVHERRLVRVVEEQELAGALIDLRMSRDALGREPPIPARWAQILERVRLESVQLTALVEAGKRDATVHHHVGAGVVLHHRSSAGSRFGPSPRGVLGDSGPQALFGNLLGEKAGGAHEPAGVLRLTVGKGHGMHQAVAVEGVVAADRLEQRRLGVAQVHPLEIVGHGALHRKIPGPELPVLGSPGTGPVGMGVVGWQPEAHVVRLDPHADPPAQSCFTSPTLQNP